jgi:3-deoxy-D-manno-octulosonic-acid transferase
VNLLDLSSRLGRVFMTLLGRSWRILYARPCAGPRLGRSRGRNVLFSFWHGRQLPLIYTHRYEDISVLVSINRDGQYVTNILHGMGFPTVRGSTSRGGFEALRSMSHILRKGGDCAITPDGPRGPAGEPKPGLAQIARLGGVPVVPMGTSGWPSVKMGSWDSFMFVLPFARMTVVEGNPVFPDAEGDQVGFLDMVRTETDRVTALADLLASPAARTQAFVARAAGRLLSLPARVWLLAAPARERRERRGRTGRAVSRPVWMHGSSLGELRGIAPLAGMLEEAGYPVHVTCFTRTGRKYLDDNNINGSYLPLDNPSWVNSFLERVRPRLLVLSETELWPCLLHATVTAGIPSVLVNARLSAGSARRYGLFRGLAGGVLSCFAAVMCRTQSDRDRFAALGVPERLLSAPGDSKSMTPAGTPDPRWRDLLSEPGSRVLVAGSTRPGEEEVIALACREAGWLPVLAPRHLHRVPEVMQMCGSRGLQAVAWSSLTGEGERQVFDAVVVDVHGILSRLYGAGDAAFVGGTIAPIGGHNVLEPLQQGVPVIVGRHHGSFRREVSEAEDLGVGHVVEDGAGLAALLRGLAPADEESEIAARSAGRKTAERFTSEFRKVLLSLGFRL